MSKDITDCQKGGRWNREDRRGLKIAWQKLKWANYSMIIRSEWTEEKQEEYGIRAKNFNRGVKGEHNKQPESRGN